LGENKNMTSHFDLDFYGGGWLSMVADLDFEPVVIDETEETKLTFDGNGAKLRRMKHKGNCPEHVDFTVKDRIGWEEHIKPFLLKPDRRRIPFENYRNSKQRAAQENRFFTWGGLGPFECIHSMCGHEHMLVGMAMDPDWVKDMVMTYCRLIIHLLEILFEEEGVPDGAWVYEDLGFKQRPFISPDMYREIIQDGYALLFDFFHSKGLNVIFHSCGFVEPLVPGLIEAGMDCLQALEVKAGMDMLRLADQFGDRIAFMGNIDVRELISNDTQRIDREMEKKIVPMVEKGYSYILHSDHSILPEVDYKSMVHWFEKGRVLGTFR